MLGRLDLHPIQKTAQDHVGTIKGGAGSAGPPRDVVRSNNSPLADGSRDCSIAGEKN